MPAEILTIPCLADNYAYLLHDPETGDTALVDAPEPGPILAALEERGWNLGQILITHHHWDHVDGVEALRKATGARVLGAAADAHRLPPLDQALQPGDSVALGGEKGVVIDAPGHTIGHIAFHFPESGAAFTADSLMALGCGRLFEGTPAQMSIEPENPALQARAREIAAKRAQGLPTVPSRLGEELATNPFLRAGEPAIRARLGMENAPEVEVFAEIRRRKDNF